jgi:hypothetical protein
MRFVIALVLGGALALSGCGNDGDSNAPVITMVEWSTPSGCVQGTASDYTVVVTATDADSDPMDLVYDGSVTGCTGDLDGVTSTITCPNAALYGGNVVVSDGDGNDSVEFTIDVCETSSITPQ